MKNWLPVLIAIAGLGHSLSFAQSQGNSSPADRYIEFVREHHVDPVAAAFAKDCGLELEGAHTSYGFANDDAGTWHVVPDLPVAYDNFEMDLINTAQVWQVGAQIVIEEWNVALDVGGYERTLYCFDSDRRLRSLDATNFQLHTDDSSPWAMHVRWVWQANGKFIASTPFEYVNMQEQRVSKPKLAKEDAAFAKSWEKMSPKAMSLAELKLPAELFR